MRKTYAIRGLMEFQALIPAGRSTVRIPFTGGALSGYGVTPATYRTSDPALQHLIEASPDFRKGRIILLRTEPMCVVQGATTQQVLSASGPDGGSTEPLSFTDMSEARDYLADHCGVERRRLKSVANIREAAHEHNITITAAPDSV